MNIASAKQLGSFQALVNFVSMNNNLSYFRSRVCFNKKEINLQSQNKKFHQLNINRQNLQLRMLNLLKLILVTKIYLIILPIRWKIAYLLEILIMRSYRYWAIQIYMINLQRRSKVIIIIAAFSNGYRIDVKKFKIT